MNNDKIFDLRPLIKLSQGGCNACFLRCNGKTLLKFVCEAGIFLFNVVSKRSYDENTYALQISNVYDNYKEYLIPKHLTYYNVSEDEVVSMHDGKALYLNSGSNPDYIGTPDS
jgi:hypothetical protein